MDIRQRDYLLFYDSIINEYNKLRGIKTIGLSQVEEYDRNNGDRSCVTVGPSFESGNTHLSNSNTLTIEFLSLKDQQFGDFIDKYYKDDFMTHCYKSDKYDYNYFNELAKKIARYLYNLWVIDSNSKNK